MTLELTVATVFAALLLAVEKGTYWWVWHHPGRFTVWCKRRGQRDPVAAFEGLFRRFKGVQLAVYAGWIGWFSYRTEWLPNTEVWLLALAALLIGVGQALNLAVFARLGRDGTFYGVRFGREVPWVTGFPFSVVPHPQYTGTVLSIWGLFLLARFPYPDWIVLPLVATAYYAFNAWFERE